METRGHRARVFLTGVVIVLLTGLLLPAAWSAEERIKIGLLTPLTGTFAQPGKSIQNGFLLYLEQAGNKLGGRSVEVIHEDDQGEPGVAVTKATKLIERDNVDLIVGPISSSVGLALRPQVSGKGVPTFLLATVDQIGDGKFIFRTSFACAPDSYLIGTLPAKAGHRKAVTVAPDFSAGRCSVEWFEKGFVAHGGTIIQKVFPPLGTVDFGPYLSALRKDADVGIVFMPGGSMAIRFIQQFAEYGLKGKLPLYGYAATVDEEILPAIGEAAEGFIGVAFYYTTIDTPENRAFVQNYSKKYGAKPNWFAAGSYTAAMVIDAAARKVGGRVRDREAFVQAAKAIQVTTPAGPFRFDENNDPIQPRYVATIRKVKGEMLPVVTTVIPDFVPKVPR